jgi:murein L,D-transpeptidase YafK
MHALEWPVLESRRLSLMAASAILIALLVVTVESQAQTEQQIEVDRIVVMKSARTMTLETNGKPLKIFKVALGTQPIGAKQQQGDHKTPEGSYIVDSKKPQSQFYEALHLSYPNPTDKAHARKLGVSPGGDVEIHGLGKKFVWIGARHQLTDWTDGCIAVTNEEIEEIFRLVPIGTRVEIKP